MSLGGNIGYSRNTSPGSSSSYNSTTYTQETSTNQFNFSPSLGYFMADNMDIGINTGYLANRKAYTTYTPATVRGHAASAPRPNGSTRP